MLFSAFLLARSRVSYPFANGPCGIEDENEEEGRSREGHGPAYRERSC